MTKAELAVLKKLLASETQQVSKGWRGASRSGYLRYSIDGLTVNRRLCESLQVQKYLIHHKGAAIAGWGTLILTDLGRAAASGK